MESLRPSVTAIGGPNGAGKSTCAEILLPKALFERHFVNADTIAKGLSAFDPEAVALEAGRVMLARLRELGQRGESFAFETTMAARSFAPFLQQLQRQGYSVHVIYIWLQSPELAIERVAERVRGRGHNIPEETIRRRYERGLRNFVSLYRPLADSWVLCDNSASENVVVAEGEREGPTHVYYRDVLTEFEERCKGG